MKTLDQDIFSGCFLVVFAVIGYVAAAQLDTLQAIGLSAAFYPNVLFTVLLFCGGGLIYQGSRRREKVALPAFQWGKILSIVLALAVYVVLMEHTGFIPSTIIFLVAAMYLFGERRKKTLAVVPVVTALVVYYLFSKAFMIVLP